MALDFGKLVPAAAKKEDKIPLASYMDLAKRAEHIQTEKLKKLKKEKEEMEEKAKKLQLEKDAAEYEIRQAEVVLGKRSQKDLAKGIDKKRSGSEKDKEKGSSSSEDEANKTGIIDMIRKNYTVSCLIMGAVAIGLLGLHAAFQDVIDKTDKKLAEKAKRTREELDETTLANQDATNTSNIMIILLSVVAVLLIGYSAFDAQEEERVSRARATITLLGFMVYVIICFALTIVMVSSGYMKEITDETTVWISMVVQILLILLVIARVFKKAPKPKSSSSSSHHGGHRRK
jgi:hypothetical protein